MRAHIASSRVVGLSLVVLVWSGVSVAADAPVVGELGPIRQWLVQNESVAALAPIGSPMNLRVPHWARSHAEQGAIVGAVVGGVTGALYFGAVGGLKCMDHSGECHTPLWLVVAGGAGGALVGGAVGGLIGSLFQTAPSPRAEPSGPRTKVMVLPDRRGVGVAVAHSF